MRIVTMTVSLLLVVIPIGALARDLAVPLDKGWQHAASGVILTANLAGLPRTTLVDAGDAELDVTAEFASPDKSTVATIYIFHPGLMSVPMWFDRAQTALELKSIYGGVKPATTDPVAFASPGASVASGLRQTYSPKRGPYRATALAIAPVGEWLVAVRVSSRTFDPVTIDPELTNILTAIRWPKTTDASPAAVPIASCARSLAFTKAKTLKPDIGQTLLGSLIANEASKMRPVVTTSAPATPWCREQVTPTVIYGVYRSGSRDGYTLGIADSGRTVAIYKAFSLPDTPDAGYSVTLSDLDGSTVSFPAFATLPQPEQVADEVLRGNPISRNATGADGHTTATIGVPKK